MYKSKITLKRKVNVPHNIQQLDVLLKTIGLNSYSGLSGMDFSYSFIITTESPLTEMQVHLINLFILEYHTANDIEFIVSSKKEKFEFDDYMDTDISGPRAEIEIDELIATFGREIEKVLVDKDLRFKRQARTAIGNLWKEKITEWLATK